MHRTLLLTLALLTALLAGCTDDATEATALAASTGGDPTTTSVPFDPDARPAAPYYKAAGTDHPGFYNALDQLATAADTGDVSFEVSYNADFGHFLTSLQGVAADMSYQFWALAHNGEPATVGMDGLALAADDTVTWTLEAFGDPPGEGSAEPGLQATAPAETRNASVPLQVRVGASATVTVTVLRNGTSSTVLSEDIERERSVAVPVPHGRSTIRVTADAGDAREVQELPIARLAELTVKVDYNGFAGAHEDRADTVWLDVDAFPSAQMYVEEGTTHPGFANAHDLLVAWEAATGEEVTYSYNADFGQFSVERISGAGNPVTASAPPWWCYTVNGEAADGITLQAIRPGDEMLWDLGTCGFV